MFKPVALAARPGLLAKLGPLIAGRRPLVRALLLGGYQHVRHVPTNIVDGYGGPVLGTAESARAFARLIKALSSDDPTLIVWGTGDVFFPLKWARRLGQLIPGTTELHTVDGARMHFPDYRADEFLAPLKRHWGGA